MRQVTAQIKEAFEQGKARKIGNTRTDGEIIDSSDWFAANTKLPDPLVF